MIDDSSTDVRRRPTRRRLPFFAALLAILLIAFSYRAGVRSGHAATTPRRPTAPDLPRLDSASRVNSAAPNVVLICIDTLRADHLGVYGYSRNTSPRIDAFAAGARVFERAYAPTPFTSPSVVSMLTGLYPQRHRVRLLWQPITDEVVTVADWLGAAHYETAAVVSNLVLADDGLGIGKRFAHYDAKVSEPEPNRPEMLERNAAHTTDAALAWLRARDAQRPFFLWVHYIDPHGPYLPPADCPTRFTHSATRPVDRARIAPYARLGESIDGNDYVDAYDAEIAYTDREVGRLLAELDASGVGASALVVITADHGEFLLEREELHFGHGFTVDEAVLHVPLIVRHPALAPGRERTPVSLADVTPTILAAAGFSQPAGLDGRSLLTRPAARPVYAEGPDLGGSGGLERCFVYPDHKVVVRHGLSSIPRESWVEEWAGPATDAGRGRGDDAGQRLAADPADPAYLRLVELIRSDPDPGGHPAGATSAAPSSRLVAGDASDDAVRKLRGLGYVQ